MYLYFINTYSIYSNISICLIMNIHCYLTISIYCNILILIHIAVFLLIRPPLFLLYAIANGFGFGLELVGFVILSMGFILCLIARLRFILPMIVCPSMPGIDLFLLLFLLSQVETHLCFTDYLLPTFAFAVECSRNHGWLHPS